MKTYFLAFDYYTTSINKFFYGIITVDLNDTQLNEVCRQAIRDNDSDIDPMEVTIKVTAFNNVED